jgi:hypothetical protein
MIGSGVFLWIIDKRALNRMILPFFSSSATDDLVSLKFSTGSRRAD